MKWMPITFMIALGSSLFVALVVNPRSPPVHEGGAQHAEHAQSLAPGRPAGGHRNTDRRSGHVGHASGIFGLGTLILFVGIMVIVFAK
jgi:hypothetical protein